MTSTLRIGLVGCGGIAPAHLAGYQHDERTRIVAVADVDAQAAQRLAEQAGATPYTDFEQMLDREHLDGVSILTPPGLHRTMACQALERGVHVFCEKPLAGSAQEGCRMAEAARQAGRLLLVAQCHRFHEPVQRARRHLDDGDLGDVFTYANRFGYLSGRPNATTRARGGVLLDNGSHSSYLFRYLAGPAARVQGWAPADQLGAVEDLCVCTLLVESDRGVGGVITLDGAANPCPNRIEVLGTRGSLLVDYGGGPSLFRPADGQAVPLDDDSLPGNHRFLREIAHFVDCMLGEAEPRIDVEEGIADLVLLEAAYTAMCRRSAQAL